MELLGPEEALEIVTRNPGVLSCAPAQLAEQTPDNIRRAASVAAGISGLFAPARNFLQSLPGWDDVGRELGRDDERGRLRDLSCRHVLLCGL